MKRASSLLAAVITGTVVAWTGGGAVVCAQATVVAVPSSWAMGAVDEGEQISATISLANRSHRVIRIERVDSGCGCIKSTVDRTVIRPAGKAALTLSLNSRGFSGIFARTVTVHLSDGIEPLSIPVTGTIRREWWVEPAMLSLSEIIAGETVRRTLVLRVRPGVQLTLESVETDDDCIEAAVEGWGSADEAHGWRIDLRVTPKARGRLASRILLRSSSPRKPIIAVPVQANVSGPIVSRPAALGFGRLRPGETRLRTLVVEHLRGRRFSVIASRVDDSRLTIDPSRTRGLAARHRLALACTARDGDSRLSGTIEVVVREEGGSEETVRIPWYALVER